MQIFLKASCHFHSPGISFFCKKLEAILLVCNPEGRLDFLGHLALSVKTTSVSILQDNDHSLLWSYWSSHVIS